MNTDNLQFIFTPDGFYVDTASINTENEKKSLPCDRMHNRKRIIRQFVHLLKKSLFNPVIDR